MVVADHAEVARVSTALALTRTEVEHKMPSDGGDVRAFLIAIGLLIGCAPNAWAQPVYFLVDASKSMDKDEQEEADKFIVVEKASLRTGTLTSTTLFGSKENGGTDCGDIAVNPLRAVSEDVPGAYSRGDFTPVGNALRVALEAAATNGGRVVVISDGADTCEVDVCEVVRSHMRRNPKALRPEFKPVGATDDTVDTYGCFISAPRGGDSREVIGGGGPPPEKISQLWWVIPLSVLNGFLAALAAVLVITTMGARSRDLSAQVKGLVEVGIAPAPAVHFGNYFLAWLPLLGPLAITVIIWWLAPSALAEGWDAIWWFMNQPAGSMLLPAALLGFSGWALAAAWDVMAKRRQLEDAEVRVKLANQRRRERETLAKSRATARENAKLARIAEVREDLLRRIAGHRDDGRELEREQLETLKSDPEDPRLIEITQRVALIVDRLEEAIVRVSDNKHLQRFDMSRADYRPIVRLMMNLDLITPDVFRALTDIFREWDSYRRGDSAISEKGRAQIETFDLQRIPTS